jgi:o-succinylbenzoate synthase
VKILAARASLAQLRFARTVRTARGDFDERSSVIFAVDGTSGLSGYGEAAPWPGFGTESLDEALAALTDAGRLLHGLEIEPGEWPAPVALRLRNAAAARAAVQGALCDLAAREAGLTLADFLALRGVAFCGAVLREVPVQALLIERVPEALRLEAQRAAAAGFAAAKIKLGAASLDEDLARARAARLGLGPGVLLRGDANGAWNEGKARDALAAVEQFDFDYVEQPLPADDVAGLARLRRRSTVRIAADESVSTEEGALRVIAAEAAQVFVLKPAMLGGAARALEIATLVRKAGSEVVFSHAFESAVGARHALHCAAAWGDAMAQHGLRTAGLFMRDVADPVDSLNGRAGLTATAGLGVAP